MIVELRPARPTDAGAMGEILHRFQQDTGWMPDLHTGAEYVAFCGAMIDCGWVTVAEVDGRVCGFMARDGDEICSLYVARDCGRLGIGRKLLNLAKARSKRLKLNVFEANDWAHRFYRRQGFAETGRSDGQDIDERLPYISYSWTSEDGR